MTAGALRLAFIDNTVDAYVQALGECARGGVSRVRLKPFTPRARAVAAACLDTKMAVELYVTRDDLNGRERPEGVCEGEPRSGDSIFVFAASGEDLSESLLDHLDAESGTIVAPRTDHFFLARPLYLISIPKAGTHLLYELARAFGYADGIVSSMDPSPGAWYCVEYSNSHTVARDFFVDSVRRAEFGNRLHPFMSAPAVFIYRNPLDILVSEAQYYHREGRTAFFGYLKSLSFDERLLRLIEDPWLFGTARDRIGGFVPWLELDNVAPVSFEELIGDAGGGDSAAQRRTIWSLQLKLHVPGDPAELGATIFNRQSATFNEGRIGAYRTRFPREALDRFCALPQDFMNAFGFPDPRTPPQTLLPRRVEEFRRRPIVCTRRDPAGPPVTVMHGIHGFNLVRFGDRYYGVPQRLGPIDLASLPAGDGGALGILRADTLADLREAVERTFVRAAVAGLGLDPFPSALSGALTAPVLRPDAVDPRIVETWHSYDIIEFRGEYFGRPQDARSSDLAGADLPRLVEEGAIIRGASPADLRERILLAELASQERCMADLKNALGRLNAAREAAERDRDALAALRARDAAAALAERNALTAAQLKNDARIDALAEELRELRRVLDERDASLAEASAREAALAEELTRALEDRRVLEQWVERLQTSLVARAPKSAKGAGV